MAFDLSQEKLFFGDIILTLKSFSGAKNMPSFHNKDLLGPRSFVIIHLIDRLTPERYKEFSRSLAQI